MSDVTNRLIVAVSGEDWIVPYEDYDLNFHSSEEEILNRVAPAVQEMFGVDLGSSGNWLYKTRKATQSGNIYIIPNSTAGSEQHLSFMDDNLRLRAVNNVKSGCLHLWSKNKLNKEALIPVLETFASLAENDPVFLAHFTSHIINKLDSKDMKVLATFASTLSDADGTPFSVGSEFVKPNLRIIGQAALLSLDPKLVSRVLELANLKIPFGSKLEATHYSKHLKTAVRKYIRYREANRKTLESIKKNGFGNIFKNLYRRARIAPSLEACQILRWKQKSGVEVTFARSVLDFSGMSDFDIANHIRKEKLSPLVVTGALSDKISPVIAVALLEQATGNQAVVLTELLESQGVLADAEVADLYARKIAAATSLDRVENIKRDYHVLEKLKDQKAERRKEVVGDIGSVFIHIDVSGSMQHALDIARDCGPTIAECIKNPEKNFHWGTFNVLGNLLPTPSKFTKDAFKAVLYGIRAGGGTNCMALYQEARSRKCNVDVFITDQGHNGPAMSRIIEKYGREGSNPDVVVVVDVDNRNPEQGALAQAFINCGIPVATLQPKQLQESALVAQAIKTAVKGPTVILDEILAEPLLTLPKWWYSL